MPAQSVRKTMPQISVLIFLDWNMYTKGQKVGLRNSVLSIKGGHKDLSHTNTACTVHPTLITIPTRMHPCHVTRERRIEAQLPWENDTASSFDDRQGLNTFFGCNHLSGDSIGGKPTFGDSTLQFWRSWWRMFRDIFRNQQLNQCLILRRSFSRRKISK